MENRAEVKRINDLISFQDGAVVSQILIKGETANVTLFAFESADRPLDRRALTPHLSAEKARYQGVLTPDASRPGTRWKAHTSLRHFAGGIRMPCERELCLTMALPGR
jgi:hypothetical protein